ncbi:hypothetical protein JCM5350_005159 [Sporobolomyces pararoseus]
MTDLKNDHPSDGTTAAAVTATGDDRPRQHKRTRAAMDPGTPKGEEGEASKGLTSNSTPVAKKGRVEGEEEEEGSTPPSPQPTTTRSEEAEEAASTTEKRTNTPPPPLPNASNSTPGTEGKETKHIRERVAAMKASSSSTPGDKEMKVDAETAAEVSESAAKLGDQEEANRDRDVEIAEVAAEVGKSSEIVNGGDSIPPPTTGEMKTDEARVADEVSKSAAKVEKEDVEIAETAAETAKVAESVPETQTTTSKSTSFVPYTGTGSKGSTTSSSFSAFSSSSSPFASVSTPSKPSAPAPTTTSAPSLDSQKPKTKTSFSASPFLSSSIPLAKKPDSYLTSTNSSTSSPSTSTSSSTTTTTTNLAAPSTPASKPLGSNSPFSAFASTSGFASSAAKPKLNPFGTPSGGVKSAFSSYSAAPSAFASVPSTPIGKSTLPTTKTSTDENSTTSSTVDGDGGETGGGDGGRKIGEPEQPDENKRIYTEQETHTGEEGDKVVHNVRAKLFAMQDGNWVERGMGPLKVNLTKREGEKDGARIVMRADATHRLLLNSPLFKEFFIEVSNEKYVRFTIIEGSEPISYMARLGNPAAAEALVAAIRERTSAL